MMLTSLGGAMLLVVFVFYLRTIGRRAKSRTTKSQTKYILEKAEILESVGNTKAALKIVNDGLKQTPRDPELLNKQKQLGER